jgi:uncharacterized LabA/DUF88 family protein
MQSLTPQIAQIEELLQAVRSQTQVCVFVDNSNVFHALRGMGSRKMDYVRLRDYLGDGRTTDVRFYYSDPDPLRDDNLDKKAARERFYKFLEEKLAFNMIRLPLRERSGYDPITLALVNRLRQNVSDEEILSITGQKSYWLNQIIGDEKVAEEKGLDCEIVYDMARLSRLDRYSGFILVAGDEDYARSVKKIRDDTGMPVEVAFFGSGRCSGALQRSATSFVDLMHVADLFTE